LSLENAHLRSITETGISNEDSIYTCLILYFKFKKKKLIFSLQFKENWHEENLNYFAPLTSALFKFTFISATGFLDYF